MLFMHGAIRFSLTRCFPVTRCFCQQNTQAANMASANIYSICNDPNQSLIYADLQLTNNDRPPVPPTKPPLKTHHLTQPHHLHHHHHPQQFHQTSMLMYQPLGGVRTLHYPHAASATAAGATSSSSSSSNNHHSSSNSNSSTPPSLSTSSTTNSNHYNLNGSLSNPKPNATGGAATNNNSNGSSSSLSGANTLNPNQFLHHTYDRPDSVKQTYMPPQRIHSPFMSNEERNRTVSASLLASRNALYHAKGEGGAHCEYAILRFDHPPSPPSHC